MKFIYKNKYWKLNEEYNTDKILYLLIDRPTLIDFNHNFYWKNNRNEDHRNYDFPCYGGYTNYLDWRKNSILHRVNNKPAAIWADSSQEYYINGKFVKKEK